MKRTIVFIIFLLAGITGYSQQKALEEIKFANETLRLAMISGSREQLQQLTSSELSYGQSSGKIENQKEYIDNIADGKPDFVNIVISNEQISLFKGTAIVRHTLSAETVNNGIPGTMKLTVLLVWAKQSGGWQLAAGQSAKLQE